MYYDTNYKSQRLLIRFSNTDIMGKQVLQEPPGFIFQVDKTVLRKPCFLLNLFLFAALTLFFNYYRAN